MCNNAKTKHIICIGTAVLMLGCCFAFIYKPSQAANSSIDIAKNDYLPEEVGAYDIISLYEELNINNSICLEAFSSGIEGFNSITAKRKNILAVADFSKPSTDQRFVVVDMDSLEILFVTYVAHGKGSGENYAQSFSNVSGSHKSSLGFYLTDSTYKGRNGYSLLLNGMEKGINDKARERAIVIHGAGYCDPKFISQAGRLGRSFGCPALPLNVNDEIIDTIKDGAVLFIYADNDEYRCGSSILSGAESRSVAQAL